MSKINLNQKVSTHGAFAVMLVLSFLLSWFTIVQGQKIVDEAKNSKAFNISKRIENNKLSH